MRQIVVNCERPRLVIIKDKFSKPCQCDYNTEEQQFDRRHKFLLHLYAEDTGNSDTCGYLGTLICYCMNADSTKDQRWCSAFGFEKIVDYVNKTDHSVDNLAVITDAEFLPGAAYEDLNLVFSRIHCILCETMAEVFCMPVRGRDVGICFDFNSIRAESSLLIRRFVGEYKDGDMRRNESDDASVMYIHKIPWPPEDLNDTSGAGVQPERDSEDSESALTFCSKKSPTSKVGDELRPTA